MYLNMRFSLLSIALGSPAIASHLAIRDSSNPVCYVTASTTDSAPAIQSAFAECGYNTEGRGTVIFGNETYTVASVMNTTGLLNVDVLLQGTLEWDNSDIDYWLNNSLPVGYQNQTSAWLFGGHNVYWNGYGHGTLNGNGQVWYDYADGASNLHGRPHQITIGNTTDSVFEGIRFVNSQMWTMCIIHAENILLQDIYVNNTSSNSSISTLNTDGADTIYANNITFNRWDVTSGDDCISTKANSTNILIQDSIFYKCLGVAIGSIGQYNNTFERIENVTARNIGCRECTIAAYFKTWTGEAVGYPPNGGGGGLGYASHILFENFALDTVNETFLVTQCTNYEDVVGNCDSSLFNMHNITVSNWWGTANNNNSATIQCSAASPCEFAFENYHVLDIASGLLQEEYLCNNTEAVGFNCTGTVPDPNLR